MGFIWFWKKWGILVSHHEFWYFRNKTVPSALTHKKYSHQGPLDSKRYSPWLQHLRRGRVMGCWKQTLPRAPLHGAQVGSATEQRHLEPPSCLLCTFSNHCALV